MYDRHLNVKPLKGTHTVFWQFWLLSTGILTVSEQNTGLGLPSSRINIRATSWQNQPNGLFAQRRVRSAWASSLSAWRKLGSLATHWAHSEDSDQTEQKPRLIWVFAGCTCHFVGFVTRPLIFLWIVSKVNMIFVLINPYQSYARPW